LKEKTDLRQGTLGLMVLKALHVLGPLHGYGIARRIEQISGDLLAVTQGTLLSRAVEAGAGRRHRVGLGRFGEQSACSFLPADTGRT
jgi:DNA-binding PadR family transcriptional regulator